MNLRRCFCCLLACVVICSGLFSVSVSAVEIDGHSVITSWAKDGEYVEFADTIVYEGTFSGDLFITIDIVPSTPIEKDTVFNLDVTFTSGTADNWTIAYLAMYGSDNKLIDSTQDVTISSGAISVQDVQATKDVHLLKMLVKPGTVLWEVSGSGGGSGATDPTEPTNPPGITFSIKGQTFYADPDMKWSAWVASDYNTGGFKVSSSSIMSPSGYGLQDDDGYISTYDKIVAGTDYYYSGTAYLGYNGYFLPDIKSFWNVSQYPNVILYLENGNTYCMLFDKSDYYFENGNYYITSGTNKVVYKLQNGSWKKYISFTSSDEQITWFDIQTFIWSNKSDICANLNIPYTDPYGNNSGTGSGSDSGSGDSSSNITMISSFDFSITSVSLGEESEQGLLSGIVGWIKNIYNGIVNLPEKFAESIKGFFDNVVKAVSALGDYLLDGIKNLFVPNATAMVENQDKWTALLEDRFGAVYESTSIIDDWANAFSYSGNQSSIVLPTITVNLAGSPFSFGGWTVDLIPAGFAPVIDTLKLITNIACTFLFVNGMKKRLESVIK